MAEPDIIVRTKEIHNLDDAVRNRGTKEDVLRLLKANADVNEKDSRGSTPIIHAVWYENIDIIQVLLDNKADPTIQNSRLNTAVHFAYEKNNVDIVNLLLTHGGSVALTQKNALGKLPADLAKSEYLRSQAVADEELEKVKNESKKVSQSSFRFCSIFASCLACMYSIPSNRATRSLAILHLSSQELKTTSLALSAAVKQNSLDDVKRLVENNADVNEKDHKGSTPLIHAVWPENVPMIEYLLHHKADPNIQNLRLNTAVHFAYEKNNEDIINLLLTYGGMMSLDVPNSMGKTPIELTESEYLRWETEEDIAEREMEEKLHKMKKEAKKAKKGALSKACKKKDLEKVKTLLIGGYDPNEANAKGSVPLMDAAWLCHTQIAEALIIAKADVNISNNRGNTALHFAYEKNSRAMVDLLLQSGASPSLKKKNCLGKKPAQLTTKQYLKSSGKKYIANAQKKVKHHK